MKYLFALFYFLRSMSVSHALVTHYPFLYFQDLIDQFQFNLKTALLCRCVQHAKVKKKKSKNGCLEMQIAAL